jgi:hypothetical protein
MKKIIYTFILLCFCVSANAGDDKTVTLITSGQGKTQDEAKQNALRNAIEQAFGAFISSHTEVVNDNLVKDEIISVSNGNIQKYEIISESALPDNLGYTTTLKTIVSISKLTSFCESKGMQIEIKGSLFAFNVIQKELAALNESKALQELVLMAKEIAPKMFDYTLLANEPIKNEIGNYSLPIKVNFNLNENLNQFNDLLIKTLHSLSLTDSELNDYKKLNLGVFSINLLTTKNNLNGDFIYYDSRIYKDGSGRKINMNEYDNNAWDAINYVQQGSARSFGDSYDTKSSISQKKYNIGNYKSTIFYFRTDVFSILKNIQEILETELYKYEVKDSKNTLINSKIEWNILLNPYTASNWPEGSRHYRRIDNLYWPCGTNRDVECIGLNEYLYNGPSLGRSFPNTFLISNIEPNTTIGFSYKCILLSLDEIKNLIKLEVKHIDTTIESNKSINNYERNTTTYIVKSGDTVGGIAQKFNVKAVDLMKYNPDIQKGIKVGQTIKIPSSN